MSESWLAIVITIVALVLIGILIRSIVGQRQEIQSLRMALRAKESDNSAVSIISELLGQSENPLDMMTEMVKVHYSLEYGHPEATEKTTYFLRDFLTVAKRYLGLTQILEYNSQVIYKRNLHDTYEEIQPGERVWVIEPGWMWEDQVLKKPVVSQKGIQS